MLLIVNNTRTMKSKELIIGFFLIVFFSSFDGDFVQSNDPKGGL